MASSAPELTSRILRHERLIIAAGITLLVALAWLFLLRGAGMTSSMPVMAPPPFSVVLLMWWVMMMAMMLPSAAPAMLLYARVRETRNGDRGISQSWVFMTGYVLIWLLFSLLAACAQRLLAGPSMALDNKLTGAVLLTAAGLYQLSPLKGACLNECRSPAQFISRHWRSGWQGAVRLGMLHGAYCVGCCWVLMALLFVGGVMNLLWIIALAVVVAIEKLAPRGRLIGRAIGVALITWGVVAIAGS